MGRRVLVIGAGCSGLVAVKECREEGLEVVCLEAQPWIGGLWRYTDNESHSSVYKSTVINTSKEMMNYSDFLIPKEYPPFMHNTHCNEYFRLYADHFNLWPNIRFNTRVNVVKPAPDYASTGRYTVKYQENDKAEVEEVFDFVMVCSGHHWKPKTPAFKGLENFKGSAIHAHAYKDHQGYENKNVLVVGVGNSGVDVCVELSRFAKQTYVATRSGTWLLTRVGPGGLPADYLGSNRLFNGLPMSVKNGLFEASLQSAQDLNLYGLMPKHRLLSAHPSINGELIGRINTGSLMVRPNIREFKENSVVYEDGQEYPCDAVIFATGYDIGFPYLDPACNVTVDHNNVSLYKYVFPPDNRHPTLCVIGLIQPWGAIMPISELQCRWTARVFSGKIKLPSVAVMHKDIQAKKDEMKKRYIASERHTIQVDYIDYCDEIADIIGCKPHFWSLFIKDPELAITTWTRGAVPSQYRLVGPKPWAGAREAILGAKDRIVYAISGGKHLRDIEKNQKRTGVRNVLRLALLLLAIYAVRTAIRRR